MTVVDEGWLAAKEPREQRGGGGKLVGKRGGVAVEGGSKSGCRSPSSQERAGVR